MPFCLFKIKWMLLLSDQIIYQRDVIQLDWWFDEWKQRKSRVLATRDAFIYSKYLCRALAAVSCWKSVFTIVTQTVDSVWGSVNTTYWSAKCLLIRNIHHTFMIWLVSMLGTRERLAKGVSSKEQREGVWTTH